MTMEVRELLSQTGLDISEHASGNSTPKRLEHCGPGHASAHQTGRLPLASGHIIPGEHPQMMLKWRMPPWMKSPLPSPLQLRPQGPAVTPSLRHSPSLGGGQQGPGRTASNQVLH